MNDDSFNLKENNKPIQTCQEFSAQHFLAFALINWYFLTMPPRRIKGVGLYYFY